MGDGLNTLALGKLVEALGKYAINYLIIESNTFFLIINCI